MRALFTAMSRVFEICFSLADSTNSTGTHVEHISFFFGKRGQRTRHRFVHGNERTFQRELCVLRTGYVLEVHMARRL